MKKRTQRLLNHIESSVRDLCISAESDRRALDSLENILRQESDASRQTATEDPPHRIDLPPDIVRIVREGPRGSSLSLCQEVIECPAGLPHLNFHLLQAAAPDIIAEDVLDRHWATWYQYRLSGEADHYLSAYRDLLIKGTHSGFLVQTMVQFYFRIWTYDRTHKDFLHLFPDVGLPEEITESLQLIASCSISRYFQMAHKLGVPNRPDLVFRRNYSRWRAKLQILSRACCTSSLMNHCAQFSAISSVLAHPDSIERNPDLESFYQGQRKLHFSHSVKIDEHDYNFNDSFDL